MNKLDNKKGCTLNWRTCGFKLVAGEDSRRVPWTAGQQGDQTSQSWRKSVLNIHWKDWCWSWNSNTLATLCQELTQWKRPWCWERLRAGGEGGDRGWDGWMASSTQWAWVWADSRRQWKDREAWRATIHGATKGQTWLSNWTENYLMLLRQMKLIITNI